MEPGGDGGVAPDAGGIDVGARGSGGGGGRTSDVAEPVAFDGSARVRRTGRDARESPAFLSRA